MIDCQSGLMKLTFGNMTVEMNIFRIDGQFSDPTEQQVNMIYKLQMDQGKDDSAEEDVEETPQSFGEICNEEIRLFEARNIDDYELEFKDRERRPNEEFRLFEGRDRRKNAGVSELFDEPVIFEWWDHYPEQFHKEHQSQSLSEILLGLVPAQNPIEEGECLSDDTQRSSEGKIVCSSYEIDNVEMIDGTKEDSVEQSDWGDDEESCDNEWLEEETLMQSGLTIGDKDAHDHIQWRYNVLFDDPENSEWGDPYLEPVREGFNPLFQPMEKEPAGLELWPNSLDNIPTLDMPETHSYNDPLYNDSGNFEQGEWIFVHERKFYENLDPCSDNMDKDKCDDCGLSVNLESSEKAIEDDELKEDQIGMDNEESCTAEKVQKKKKVRRRKMCDRRSDERTCLRSYNVNINSLKRTHYQSGKRVRGRNRPSLI